MRLLLPQSAQQIVLLPMPIRVSDLVINYANSQQILLPFYLVIRIKFAKITSWAAGARSSRTQLEGTAGAAQVSLFTGCTLHA